MPLDPSEVWAALSPEEQAAALAAATRAAERDAPTLEGPVDDGAEWTALDEFLDDTLLLSYRGSHYRLPSADIETGLLCQQYVSGRDNVTLDDDEEQNLFLRLLGGQQWLVKPVPAHPAEPDEDNPDELTLAMVPEVPGIRNPRYDPELDVWKQLHDEGRSWAFVKHMGSTAIMWAALGTDFALDYWQTGGRRPKAEPTPPAKKMPQDRRRKGTGSKTR